MVWWCQEINNMYTTLCYKAAVSATAHGSDHMKLYDQVLDIGISTRSLGVPAEWEPRRSWIWIIQEIFRCFLPVTLDWIQAALGSLLGSLFQVFLVIFLRWPKLTGFLHLHHYAVLVFGLLLLNEVLGDCLLLLGMVVDPTPPC